MALNDEGNAGIPATMLVGPTGIGNNSVPYPYPIFSGMGMSNGGMGGFGNDGGWIVLLLIIILVAAGGWGNNGNGNSAFGGGAPIVINDGNGGAVQRGFDQAAVMSGVGAIQSGIANLSTQLCNCCGDMQMSLANGFAGVNSAITNAQMADLERSFAAQTASMQGMNNIQSQLAQCCCDNRLATESLRATVLSENCADRYEAANNTRDIIDSQTRSTQAILDKLCQLELDGYKRENDNLRSQLSDARFAASQVAQTAQLREASNDAVDALYSRLSACPVPTQPVYGSQPIFTCPNNNGCGCGCNGGF